MAVLNAMCHGSKVPSFLLGPRDSELRKGWRRHRKGRHRRIWKVGPENGRIELVGLRTRRRPSSIVPTLDVTRVGVFLIASWLMTLGAPEASILPLHRARSAYRWCADGWRGRLPASHRSYRQQRRRFPRRVHVAACRLEGGAPACRIHVIAGRIHIFNSCIARGQVLLARGEDRLQVTGNRRPSSSGLPEEAARSGREFGRCRRG